MHLTRGALQQGDNFPCVAFLGAKALQSTTPFKPMQIPLFIESFKTDLKNKFSGHTVQRLASLESCKSNIRMGCIFVLNVCEYQILYSCLPRSSFGAQISSLH